MAAKKTKKSPGKMKRPNKAKEAEKLDGFDHAQDRARHNLEGARAYLHSRTWWVREIALYRASPTAPTEQRRKENWIRLNNRGYSVASLNHYMKRWGRPAPAGKGPTPEARLSVQEAQDFLGIGSDDLHTLLQNGLIPYTAGGDGPYIQKSNLIATKRALVRGLTLKTIFPRLTSVGANTGEGSNPDAAEAPEDLSAKQIITTCDGIKTLLLGKNKKYGDSALNPKRVFSKASAKEQILVRIDDKLSRIQTTGFADSDEDTLRDLIGYLILLKIAIFRDGGEKP